MLPPDHFNQVGADHLPGHLDLVTPRWANFRCTQMLLYPKAGL